MFGIRSSLMFLASRSSLRRMLSSASSSLVLSVVNRVPRRLNARAADPLGELAGSQSDSRGVGVWDVHPCPPQF